MSNEKNVPTINLNRSFMDIMLPIYHKIPVEYVQKTLALLKEKGIQETPERLYAIKNLRIKSIPVALALEQLVKESEISNNSQSINSNIENIG